MKLSSAALSDVGQKRDNNEDSYVVDNDLGVYVVCDGLGGHSCGEVASRRAAEIVAEGLHDHRAEIDAAREVPGGYFKLVSLVEDVVQEACGEVHRVARSQRQLAGMATTLTMVLVVDTKAIMAHVGDTRLYVLRQGELHLLSVDHTMAQDLVQRGVLKPEEAEVSQYANALTRCVGHQECVAVDTLLFDLLPLDTCLLCSDGLTRHVTDRTELAEHLGRTELERIPSRLVAVANERGGEDNITAVVFRMDPEDDRAGGAPQRAGEVQRQLDLLRSVPIFRDLSLNQLVRVRNACSVRCLEAEETLFDEGESCSGLGVVLDGRLVALRGGEKVGEVVPSGRFGELSLVRERPSGVAVRAFGGARVLILNRADLNSLVRRFPKLGARIQANLLQLISHDLDELARVQSAPRPGWF